MGAGAPPIGQNNPGPARLLKIIDSRTIAERLGLPEDVVRAVQRHGVLQRLDLDDAEVRERLWRGHCSRRQRLDSASVACLADRRDLTL